MKWPKFVSIKGKYSYMNIAFILWIGLIYWQGLISYKCVGIIQLHHFTLSLLFIATYYSDFKKQIILDKYHLMINELMNDQNALFEALKLMPIDIQKKFIYEFENKKKEEKNGKSTISKQ